MQMPLMPLHTSSGLEVAGKAVFMLAALEAARLLPDDQQRLVSGKRDESGDDGGRLVVSPPARLRGAPTVMAQLHKAARAGSVEGLLALANRFKQVFGWWIGRREGGGCLGMPPHGWGPLDMCVRMHSCIHAFMHACNAAIVSTHRHTNAVYSRTHAHSYTRSRMCRGYLVSGSLL